MTGKATVIEIKPAIPAVAFQPGLETFFELSRTGSSTPSVKILSFAGQLWAPISNAGWKYRFVDENYNAHLHG